MTRYHNTLLDVVYPYKCSISYLHPLMPNFHHMQKPLKRTLQSYNTGKKKVLNIGQKYLKQNLLVIFFNDSLKLNSLLGRKHLAARHILQ